MERTQSTTRHEIAFFIALMATALALGAALAHGLELPNKIGMAREEYFVVQKVYAGWNRLAILLATELAGMLSVIFLYRRDPPVLRPALVGLVSLALAQAIFWVFTFPANRATNNWLLQPPNWEALRWQWEYSHLAGAALQALAMAALIVSVLRARRP